MKQTESTEPDENAAPEPSEPEAAAEGSGEEAALADVGKVVGHVDVQIGPQFLELFSEHLYSSPNKAFEELVSNSWDAGAKTVHIGISADLEDAGAAVWVLDDGVSMDVAGLELLWSVATSKKREEGRQSERPQIGKFGIGKLATYLLADCLTYVCRASDGVIRTVTMDYRRIGAGTGGDAAKLHIDPIPLELREVSPQELPELLAGIGASDEILRLIDEGIPRPEAEPDYENEFCDTDVEPATPDDTWTLAVLTSLKPAGRSLQRGYIKRMLRAALPLGSSVRICFDGDLLPPAKVATGIDTEWILGRDLGITGVTIREGEEAEEERKVAEDAGGPHVEIEGIEGPVTGRVRLYEDRISGGKSEALGASNGFFINVLGRVINADDPYFGLENLNHSAWAKFRATVRADGLDPFISVDREDLLESPDLEAFRRFLFALFNKARSTHDAAQRASWPDAGQVLTESWGTVPLESLRRAIADGLAENALPAFVDASGVDAEDELQRWQEAKDDAVGDLITDVALDDLGSDSPFVIYELGQHRVIVNSRHPFAQEHGESHEQQMLLRDAGLADLLTQAFMADLGLDPDVLGQIGEYRDNSLRLLAQRRRRTGAQLAALLVDATSHEKGLERVVGDALEYMGFVVDRMGQSGKPEGVARAPTEAEGDDGAISYSFTYDAKSTGRAKVKTGNCNVAGLARHRREEGADYSVLVGPDFEAGALDEECKNNAVTPVRARDLARLLMVAGTHGPRDLAEMEDLLKTSRTPAESEAWIDEYIGRARDQPTLSYDLLLAAIEQVGLRGPDPLTGSVLARVSREISGDEDHPKRSEVISVLRGLEVLLPALVRVSGDNVYIGTSASKLREAIRASMSAIPFEYRFGREAPSEAEAAATE